MLLILLLEIRFVWLVLFPLHLLLHLTGCLEMLPLYCSCEFIRTDVRNVLVYRRQNADAIILVLICPFSIALSPKIFEIPLSNNKLTSLIVFEGD